jgi:hypothetical protein
VKHCVAVEASQTNVKPSISLARIADVSMISSEKLKKTSQGNGADLEGSRSMD